MTFFPLDRDLLTSSLWAQASPEVLKVWVYLLVKADPRNGIVGDADPAVALHCGLSLEATEEALEYLAGSDSYSRTREHEGRRIARLPDGGFQILNYIRHRDRDHSTPRVRRFRERQAAKHETEKRRSTVTETTDTDTDTDNGTAAPPRPRRRQPDHAAANMKEATRFVECFNRTFSRRVSVTPKLGADFAARAGDGYSADLLVSLPILVDAQGLPDDLRKALKPAWLLRNGERGYTSKNGDRHPGKAWIEDALQGADNTRLWERHVETAGAVGCLDELKRLGCRLPAESGS